jgi:hypothetical protein
MMNCVQTNRIYSELASDELMNEFPYPCNQSAEAFALDSILT